MGHLTHSAGHSSASLLRSNQEMASGEAVGGALPCFLILNGNEITGTVGPEASLLMGRTGTALLLSNMFPGHHHILFLLLYPLVKKLTRLQRK